MKSNYRMMEMLKMFKPENIEGLINYIDSFRDPENSNEMLYVTQEILDGVDVSDIRNFNNVFTKCIFQNEIIFKWDMCKAVDVFRMFNNCDIKCQLDITIPVTTRLNKIFDDCMFHNSININAVNLDYAYSIFNKCKFIPRYNNKCKPLWPHVNMCVKTLEVKNMILDNSGCENLTPNITIQYTSNYVGSEDYLLIIQKNIDKDGDIRFVVKYMTIELYEDSPGIIRKQQQITPDTFRKLTFNTTLEQYGDVFVLDDNHRDSYPSHVFGFNYIKDMDVGNIIPYDEKTVDSGIIDLKTMTESEVKLLHNFTYGSTTTEYKKMKDSWLLRKIMKEKYESKQKSTPGQD